MPYESPSSSYSLVRYVRMHAPLTTLKGGSQRHLMINASPKHRKSMLMKFLAHKIKDHFPAEFVNLYLRDQMQ